MFEPLEKHVLMFKAVAWLSHIREVFTAWKGFLFCRHRICLYLHLWLRLGHKNRDFQRQWRVGFGGSVRGHEIDFKCGADGRVDSAGRANGCQRTGQTVGSDDDEPPEQEFLLIFFVFSFW